MKFGQFVLYSKRNNFIKKLCKNCVPKTSSRLFFVSKELSTTSIEKYLKQSTYITYLIAKLSKLVQISMLDSPDITGIQATLFIEFFDKKFYFVLLRKLAKFHYQTVLTSQVIQ